MRWYLKLQNYDFILWHILGKKNTRADILSRKDQIDTKDNNKDLTMLKNKLWTRRVSTEAEVIVLGGNQVVEETTLLDKIRRNKTTEQEVQKELKKDNGQA